jgi:hypothetical protein
MSVLVAVNYPAPIPVGHLVEVTEYEDVRPERKRRGAGLGEAFQHPVLLDVDTGIRFMNHVHASAGANGGNAHRPNRYPRTPRPELPVNRVWRGRVLACALVYVEALSTQHTTLELEPDPPA